MTDKRVVVELQLKQVLLFLDVSQAFDEVWHSAIRITQQNRFPTDLYVVILSIT